ncbi:hypothetical protein Drorol1_Dr00020559 [Drosera rotundifolia]
MVIRGSYYLHSITVGQYEVPQVTSHANLNKIKEDPASRNRSAHERSPNVHHSLINRPTVSNERPKLKPFPVLSKLHHCKPANSQRDISKSIVHFPPQLSENLTVVSNLTLVKLLNCVCHKLPSFLSSSHANNIAEFSSLIHNRVKVRSESSV